MLKLKTNEKITLKGIELDSTRAAIDQNNGNKRDRQQIFTLEIYATVASRLAAKTELNEDNGPWKSYDFIVNDDEFDKYFSPTALGNYDNHYHAAYSYVMSKPLHDNGFDSTIWESDEII